MTLEEFSQAVKDQPTYLDISDESLEQQFYSTRDMLTAYEKQAEFPDIITSLQLDLAALVIEANRRNLYFD